MNKIPAGYKKTEVGVIPEDWEIKRLGEIVNFLDGQRRPIKNSDRAKIRGQYPYYGASGIIDYVNDYIFNDELLLLGEDGENILSRNLRLVFKVKGKIWVNNHAHVLKPKDDYDIDYLSEKLESLDYEQLNTGTAQPKLNQKTCWQIPVACPPTKAEQTAIATALNDADALITQLEKLIAKKRLIKQGAMQQLLTGKKRLAGFDRHPDGRPKGHKQTPLGPLPEDWNVFKLSELVNMKSGVSITSKHISLDGKYPCYGGNGLRGYTDQFTHSGRFALIGRQGALCGNVQFVSGDFFASEHAIVVTAKANTEIKLLYYVLIEMNLNQYSESSAQPGLSVAKILDLPLPYPVKLAEQTAIATIITDVETELEALEARLAKHKQIKQGMMQTLLTGKIRLL